MSPPTRLVWFELTFPAGLSTESAVSFVRSLAGRGRAGWLSPLRPVVFELRSSKDGATWFAGLPESEADRLRSAMEAWLPGLAAAPVAGKRSTTSPSLAVELRVRSARRPLRSELQAEVSPALLRGLSGLRKDEQVVVSWVVGGWLPRSAVPPPAKGNDKHDVWDILDWGTLRLTTEETTEARKKQSEQLFACAGRVAVEAASGERRRSLVTRVVGAYQLLRVSGAGLSRRSLPSWWVSSRTARNVVNQIDPACVLRADELVAVLGWPVGLDENISLPGVELSQSKLLRPDRRVLRPLALPGQPSSDRIVAESAYPSEPGNLVLTAEAARTHLWAIGPTGVGKSTLLANLILQDIDAGHGVVVVDPKGDLVDDVVRRLSPEALKRIAVLDPSDPAPIGINPLASLRRTTSGSGVAVDGLLGVLHSLWASSWGPRLHDVLHAGLLTMALDDQKDGQSRSLVELPVLLTNPAFRRPLVARATAQDPLGLGSFWSWFDHLSDEQAAQVLAPVMNKLRQFILRPDLRAVLGQAEPRFAISQVFEQSSAHRRSLLVRLPKGELGGEAAALLGSLVVQQVWQATLARSAVPARSRHPVIVYLDEFQEFVRLPLDLGDALAQARGLGVGLVLAHQHLGQLSPDLRAGVLANAGSKVAFRLDYEDASVLSRRSGGKLRAEDFASLPPFHAYADLVAEGAPRGFASAKGRPLGPPVRSLDGIRRSNRQAWGVPRSETEARLRRTALGEGPTSKSSSGRVGHEPAAFGVVPDAEDLP